MAKVAYKQGLKQTYLSLDTRPSNALYWCTDTRELFKGDDLYSDGVRFAVSFEFLPTFALAAEGILYICRDNGNGYVLNETRDGWVQVVFGVDNETIGINALGLMCIKAVPLGTVTGLEDSLKAIEAKILELQQTVTGGVTYRGAVETYDDLPTDAAVGDLYEVREDNSEWCWNGEQWFEYGHTGAVDLTGYATRDEVNAIAELVKYEVSHKPTGTIVNYTDEEIRVMCAANTEWALQQSGEGADPNLFYIGFKAYAPNDEVVSFKEDLAEIITDSTMYYFEGNDFAGVDEFGRKYSIVWLPVAHYDSETGAWTYYGNSSSVEKYIGWYYSVEWYNASGVKVAADTIRINLTNEDCHLNTVPYYVANVQSVVSTIEESVTWSDM